MPRQPKIIGPLHDRAVSHANYSPNAQVCHRHGESLTDCAIREVREESGLQVRLTGLIGTYTDPHVLIAYSDGEVRQEFTFVYAAEIESGELNIDDESKEGAWVPLSSALELPLAESQRRRLKRYAVSEGVPNVFAVTPMPRDIPSIEWPLVSGLEHRLLELHRLAIRMSR